MGIIAGATAAGVLALLVGVWVGCKCCCNPPPPQLPNPTPPTPEPTRPTPEPILQKSLYPNAVAELGSCVLAGTFLGAMAGPALEGLLIAGEAVPFVGDVCQALLALKRHVDDLQDEGGEYWRLSVWSQTLNPEPKTPRPKP